MSAWDRLSEVFVRGGPVMWPLLVLSLVSVALCCERILFWLRTHGPAQRRRTALLGARIRAADADGARALAEADPTVYGWFARAVVGSAGPPRVTDAQLREIIEEVRPPIERFSVTLSTIITAAPMLGILGTVTGIIESFGLLGGEAISDPALVADGIAEALYTTVFGLVVALIALFPYVIFRSHSDRAFNRLEALGAAALESFGVARPPG